ncbi:cation:proton antiporter [Halobiforma lacisalsi AJ5]|uniref:Cation:proton antiporter n=1 Tax=Natronobacterium lacisalsi AJ5 TaxID=358396 RepID=M0L4P8_NATLA|nr:sodium:proton antiporter [Halobiforma lacisalsi]APW97987.1 cation:proton antiporter [Halobiforma lacisalsi AJ5]EMA28542.1 NADH-ubiquinone oxidoreductase subunit 4L [Halobiforma lacisalsi AJ5]
MTGVILAGVIGALFALGTFLLLRRDLIRVVWGLAIISQAANVYLLAMGGVAEGTAETVPVLEGHGHEVHVPMAVADPLVQALVLTAIVIGFGMTAFALVLSYRVYEEHGTLDVSKLGDRE